MARNIQLVIPAEPSREPGPRSSQMTREHMYFVYILASQRNGTLYTGVTNNLIRRVQNHREGLVAGFTKKICRQVARVL